MQFLVAMVPDPERTQLSLTFDRDVESIMRAFQDSGYSFSRAWLPWRAEAAAESNDPEIRKKNREEKTERESYPGLMLFRQGDALLAVFLVGETPTSGVDRPQFSRASGYIRDLSNPDVQSHFLGTLGPEFSGSFASLKTATDESMSGPEWASAPIVSGSTTSEKLVNEFRAQKNFSTTVRDDESAYCLLRKQFPDWERVALLSEDGTGYSSAWQVEEWPCEAQAFTPIYYPREISRLRNAYQADPALAAPPKGEESTTRRQLLLPLRDSQSGSDMLPQFSGEQTPASQETVLFQISEILKRERSQAAIIRATNVLDALFLSRFLRQCCADLRVAVLNNPDLLFVHGTDSLDYLGVIAVGSGSLRLEGKEERVFPSSDSEGVYHAAKLLLGRGSDKLPPLWISVVGRGTYWPVAVEDGGGVEDTRFDPKTGYPSRLWDAVFYTSSLLALLYVAIYIYALRKKEELPRWCADFHPSPGSANRGRAAYHALLTVFSLAAYCALSFAPAYLFFVYRAPAWEASAWWSLAVMLVLAGMAMHTARRYVGGLLGLGLASAAAAAAVGWIFAMYQPDPLYRGLLSAERSVELLSGVAPSLPLAMLFLALAYWAWVNMQRFIFVEERDTGAIELGSLTQDALGRINRPLHRPIFAGSWRRGGGILIVVAFSGYLGSRWIGTLEPSWFDRFYLTLVTTCAGLLLLTTWAYFRVWRRLRRGLQALDLHPIRFAFAALPTVSTWSPLWQPTARTRSYSVPERMVETTRKLECQDDGYYSGLSADRRQMEDALNLLMEPITRGLREGAKEARGMNALQNAVAKNLARELERSSWSQGSSATLKKIEEHQPKGLPSAGELPGMLAAEAVAIRYVAFIRYVMLHLKNQLSFMTVGFILLAISLNCYSFQGEGYFRWWLAAIFLVLSSTSILVFMEMAHDATLSNLTDSKAGKLDPSFYFKVVSAGALPLLTLVSSQFPDIGRVLFSWLQPALSALH